MITIKSVDTRCGGPTQVVGVLTKAGLFPYTKNKIQNTGEKGRRTARLETFELRWKLDTN